MRNIWCTTMHVRSANQYTHQLIGLNLGVKFKNIEHSKGYIGMQHSVIQSFSRRIHLMLILCGCGWMITHNSHMHGLPFGHLDMPPNIFNMVLSLPLHNYNSTKNILSISLPPDRCHILIKRAQFDIADGRSCEYLQFLQNK